MCLESSPRSGGASSATLTELPEDLCARLRVSKKEVAVGSGEEGVINVLVIPAPGTMLVLSEQSWHRMELTRDSATEQQPLVRCQPSPPSPGTWSFAVWPGHTWREGPRQAPRRH